MTAPARRQSAVAWEPLHIAIDALRPRSSYLRFAAEQPNECWQSDFTQVSCSWPPPAAGHLLGT
jgi:transposase InsO family protein